MTKRRAKGRAISGIFLLDKPTGISSNGALQIVKRLFNAQKAGHTGSLDPLASGLLPICLGEATKMAAYLLDSDKRYHASITLGITTTTGDSEGEVTAVRPVPPLDRAQIERVLTQFVGEISQTPPMHSALKRNGQPLYKLAHQGIEIAREPRQITIHEIVLQGYDTPVLDVEVFCSKGTYIRTLAEDIGAALGCGAHVSGLRRTGVGCYGAALPMVTIDYLQEVYEISGSAELDKFLLPIESALFAWPELKVSPAMAFFLARGEAVTVSRDICPGWVRIYKGDQHFLGVGCVTEESMLTPKRIVRME